MYNQNWGPQGWTCPQCGKVWSPQTSGCLYCNVERKTFATTNVKITPFDDQRWWNEYNKRTTGDVESILNNWKTFTTADVEITPSGAYIYHGTGPEVHY